MDENQGFKLELLFTDMRFVIDFLEKQNIFENLQEYYSDVLYKLKSGLYPTGYTTSLDPLQMEEQILSFKKKVNGATEHLDNILFIIDQIVAQEKTKE